VIVLPVDVPDVVVVSLIDDLEGLIPIENYLLVVVAVS